MMAYLYGIAAGLLAVAIEAHFKQAASYWANLWAYTPLAVVLNWLVFQLVRSSPSLPAAFIIFGMSTLTLRVAVSLWMGHSIGMGTWAACGLMICAAALRAWRP